MRYFSWHSAKARANIRNHGISFEIAQQAFSDPYLVQDFDWNPGGEMRWHTIGMVRGTLLVLVVHTTEEENGDEYIRIISARKAEKDDEEKYYSTNRHAGYFRL